MQVKGQTVMSGTSQDELIVISVSGQSLYFTLESRDSESIVLRDNQSGQQIVVTVLKTFEFTSDRKMMTVVCKMNGKTYAFVKGADTSIEPRCVNLDNSDKMTLDDLDDFAEQGLRTLVYAYKEMADLSEHQVGPSKWKTASLGLPCFESPESRTCCRTMLRLASLTSKRPAAKFGS
jgi:magnesium-transporting ATPase (P-type)